MDIEEPMDIHGLHGHPWTSIPHLIEAAQTPDTMTKPCKIQMML
jgi:hypothetical protein